jgi:hypothetical protein
MEADKTTDARSGGAIPATMIVDDWIGPEITETMVSVRDPLGSRFNGTWGSAASPASTR